MSKLASSPYRGSVVGRQLFQKGQVSAIIRWIIWHLDQVFSNPPNALKLLHRCGSPVFGKVHWPNDDVLQRRGSAKSSVVPPLRNNGKGSSRDRAAICVGNYRDIGRLYGWVNALRRQYGRRRNVGEKKTAKESKEIGKTYGGVVSRRVWWWWWK